MRIAYEHADSFVTYPQAPNLSASGRPVSCRHAYSFLRSWALLVAVWAASSLLCALAGVGIGAQPRPRSP